MSESKLQEKFISLLKEKMQGNLTNELFEILPLGKEAIYRRLRGDVPFSFSEMAILSAHLGISLDYIANIVSPYRSKWYQLHVRDYTEFKPVDLFMSYNYIKVINLAADNPYSEFGVAANMLPLHISLLHVPIYRLYLLKWTYQFGKVPRQQLSYSSLQIPEEEIATYQPYLDAVERIKYTFFVWDNSFLTSLINDIKYFHDVLIINQEEVLMLKEELFSMLNTLEKYADKGVFDTTGNKVEIYVSALNFDTSYSYISSDNISVSMSNAYNLGAFTSLEKDACEEMKTWIQGLKKSSVLISGVAQRDRIVFFEKQRAILRKEMP